MILMPEALTAENGAKAALIGEFYETTLVRCPECDGNPDDREECEFCEGAGELTQRVPVQWTTIKEIYKRAVALLGQSQTDAIAEAVAAERERCLRLIKDEGITPAIPDDPDPVAEAINAALQSVCKAIRSAAK